MHRWCRSLLAVAMAGAGGWALAQGLPPIYDQAPVQLADSRVLSEFGVGAFLENVSVGKRGSVFVTDYPEGKVYRIDASGRVSTWAKVDGKIAGIALNPDGSALLSGWIKGTEAGLFSVSPAGRATTLLKLPGGQFPNGIIRVAAHRYWVADSYRGAIWEVDAVKKSARIWLEHELLARADTANPVPGVNGLKVFEGALYVSNTQKQLLVRVPIDAQGQAGKPEVMMDHVGLDDFAFDRHGVLYGATHVYNSVVRLDRDRKVSVIAGLEQGMAGSTAVGVLEDGAQVRLVVTTNGGASLPPPGGVQTGKVVVLTVPAVKP